MNSIIWCDLFHKVIVLIALDEDDNDDDDGGDDDSVMIRFQTSKSKRGHKSIEKWTYQ